MTAAETLDVDVLVVGSGNGGMTAALCAYELGLKNVLVVEKNAKYGGTSATSGGGVWIPCNRYALAAGANDTLAEGREYLRGAIPAGSVPEDMLDTYVQEGPRMIDFLHERTRVRYLTLAHYPDYFSNLPGAKNGHRSMEPEPVLRSELGADGANLTETHDMMWILDRISFTQEEALILFGRPPGWKRFLAKLIWRYLTDFPWILTNRRSRNLACGDAGVARLRWSMLDRNIPLWLSSPFVDLVTSGGRVTGAIVERGGKKIEVRAKHGVVLAAGGFERNQELRERYLPKPTNAAWSASAGGTNTGDTLVASLKIGAATRLMNGAWWCTTFKAPDTRVPYMAVVEKSFPGSCVVNRRGKRIANESQNYISFMLEYFRKHTEQDPQVPMWMVFDARFRKSYMVGPLQTAGFRPDWTLPASYTSSGFFTKARAVAELAKKAGIDGAGLEQTIAAMNSYAAAGKDLEFGRGDTEYDRYYGDPRVTPNPCLAPIVEAPFYAVRMEPGDFGTHGGLSTNVNGQVLHENGAPIPGLYATGNCAAAILPTYPGPGSTLGPAMTFAWQAAKHMAGVNPGN